MLEENTIKNNEIETWTDIIFKIFFQYKFIFQDLKSFSFKIKDTKTIFIFYFLKI